MSRIGNKPITVPAGVEVQINGSIVEVKGPKGALSLPIETDYVAVKFSDGTVTVERKDDSRESRARHGLFRSLIANMVGGVVDGYQKRLEIRGVGFRGSMKGDTLEMFLGYSHPINYKIPSDVQIIFDDKSQTMLTVSGIDKQKVGQVAAKIRSYRTPEVYKGKGVRYEGEYVRVKAGKSAKAK